MSKLKYSIYLNNASRDFGEYGFDAILAVFISLVSLFLLFLFPVAGIALMVFAYGFLCVGAKSVLLGIVRKKFLPIESIFSKFNICIKAFCLKLATTLITMLWSLVFIVPGIVTALNYSFASFVMADENLNSLECMSKSKKLVYGHRGEIFVLYLSYLFVVLVDLCLSAGLGLMLNKMLNVNMYVSLVIAVVLALFILIVFIAPYYELMFAEIYQLLKNENNKETQQKRKSIQNKVLIATENN